MNKKPGPFPTTTGASFARRKSNRPTPTTSTETHLGPGFFVSLTLDAYNLTPLLREALEAWRTLRRQGEFWRWTG